MTSNPISARLRSCQSLVNALRATLEEARALATQQRYSQNWLDAIDKALTDNEAAWGHLHNIATLIELVAPPIPL